MTSIVIALFLLRFCLRTGWRRVPFVLKYRARAAWWSWHRVRYGPSSQMIPCDKGMTPVPYNCRSARRYREAVSRG
jgi:hypothetical protein